MELLVISDFPEETFGAVARIAPEAVVHRASTRSEAYTRLLPRADVLVGLPPPEDLARATRLRWLQLTSAGVNRYAGRIPEGVTVTNARGAYDVPTAEHVLALMLALVRHLPAALDARHTSTWERRPDADELCGATCGILGLGSIGLEVARRAKAFGMRVLALKRHPRARPSCVDALYGPEEIDRVLEAADHLVIALPLTGETRGLLGRERLHRMKQGSRLYNIGRGGIVDEPALVEALRSGHLAGAGLDVFEEEPLPADSPLWKLPGVVVTPHVAGSSLKNGARVGRIFTTNLERFIAGRPLENRVDMQRGY